MKYKKRPVIIEAFQMTKKTRWDNKDWPAWLNEAWQRDPGENAVWINSDDPEGEALVCGTLEGVHCITFGDYIIKGIKGEIYPCKPDVFEASYDKVEAV